MNIKSVREKRGLTQEKLANSLNVECSTVAMWETGKSIPRADKLPEIANALACSIDELFYEVNSSITLTTNLAFDDCDDFAEIKSEIIKILSSHNLTFGNARDILENVKCSLNLAIYDVVLGNYLKDV